MSRREDKILSLANGNWFGPSEVTLHEETKPQVEVKPHEAFKQRLHQGIHGIGFSAYGEGQKPGDQLTEEQVRTRMDVIRPHVKWVRSFSCSEGNEFIPQVAKEHNIQTLVGAWISEDREKNEIEIQSLIELARSGHVDIAAVGNEVLYREELEEDELLEYITRVKAAIPGIPVGYVDAYYEFENRPALSATCDVILANCYPFWEGCHIDHSTLYMQDMYKRAQKAAEGKKVIITETGWPDTGEAFHGAVPSRESAIRYFLNTQEWSVQENIELFYFSSFDESWKTFAEGDVGTYWGLWDKNHELKFQVIE